MSWRTFLLDRLRTKPAETEDDVESFDHRGREDEVPSLTSLKSICIVGFCATAMVVNIGGLQSMTIALPTIGRDLGIPASTLQWIITGYALTSGCFLLLFGRLADIFGRKHLFLIGMLWLVAFSVGCGVAQNGISIIIMRALAGMGPAATVPAALGILAHTFPPSHARSVAFATFSAGAPIGAATGLILGGLLTQYVSISWRAVFFVLAGIAGLVFIGAFFVFPPDDALSHDKRVDWVGAAFITVGLVLFTFCLGEGEIAPQGWNTPYIIVLLIISLILVGCFIAWEYYVEQHTTLPPLMRLSLWARANGKFAAIQVIGFFAWSAFSTFAFWATLYYQNYLQLDPVLTMLRFIPMSVTGFTVNVVFALVAGRVSAQLLIMIGATGTGMGNLLFAIINPESLYWAFGFPAAIVSVFGADFIFASSTLFGAKCALPHEQSLAGGIFNTVIQTGTAFGMTITTIVYDKVVRAESQRLGVQLNGEGSNAPPGALLKGYKSAQWTSFAFAMLALLVATVFLRGIGIIGGHGPQEAVGQDPKKGAGDSHQQSQALYEKERPAPAAADEDTPGDTGAPSSPTATLNAEGTAPVLENPEVRASLDTVMSADVRALAEAGSADPLR